MATDIGTLALKLVADPTSFESGLVRAEQSAQQFGQKIGAVSGNVLKAFDAIKAHPVGAAIAALVAILTTLQSATAGTVAELKSLVSEGQHAAAAQSSLERKFGMSAEAAGGFSLQAKKLGLDTGEVSGAMIAFQRQLGDAAAGNEAAAKSFARLGLDAKELTKLPVEQQLGKIGDALRAIPNTAERTSAAYAVLTRRGAALVPVIQGGTAAMTEAQAQSQRWGLTFAAGDSALVRQGVVAQKTAQTAVDSIRQSFANSFAVLWAPMQKGFADLVVKIVDKAEPVLAWLRDGIKKLQPIAEAIVAGFERAWEAMGPTFDAIIAQVLKIFDSLSGSLGTTDDWADTLGQIAEFLATGVLTGVAAVLQTVVDTAEAAADLWHWWEQIAATVGKAIKPMLEFLGIQKMLDDAAAAKAHRQADATRSKKDAKKKPSGDIGDPDSLHALLASNSTRAAGVAPKEDFHLPTAFAAQTTSAIDAMHKSMMIGHDITDPAKELNGQVAGIARTIDAIHASMKPTDAPQVATAPATSAALSVPLDRGPQQAQQNELLKLLLDLFRGQAPRVEESWREATRIRELLARGQGRTVSIP